MAIEFQIVEDGKVLTRAVMQGIAGAGLPVTLYDSDGVEITSLGSGGGDGSITGPLGNRPEAEAVSVALSTEDLAAIQEVHKAEDAAHTTGDKGIMALAVRKDTAAALAGADGDYTPLITDDEGGLYVSPSPTADARETAMAASLAAAAASLTAIENDNTTAPIEGSISDDAAVSTQKPVVIGATARTTNRTSVSDGDAVRLIADKQGRGVNVPHQVRELITRTSGVITITSTTETTIMAAGGSGILLDMLSIKLVNTSATAVRVDIRDVTAGTVQDTWLLPPTDTRGIVFPVPFKQTTANSAWTAQLSGAVTDVRITAQFAINV